MKFEKYDTVSPTMKRLLEDKTLEMKGKRVMATGEHPHAGEAATVIGFEILKITHGVGMLVRNDAGEEYFICDPKKFKYL